MRERKGEEKGGEGEREERRIQNGRSWEEEKYGREDESDERDMRESL